MVIDKASKIDAPKLLQGTGNTSEPTAIYGILGSRVAREAAYNRRRYQSLRSPTQEKRISSICISIS